MFFGRMIGPNQLGAGLLLLVVAARQGAEKKRQNWKGFDYNFVLGDEIGLHQSALLEDGVDPLVLQADVLARGIIALHALQYVLPEHTMDFRELEMVGDTLEYRFTADFNASEPAWHRPPILQDHILRGLNEFRHRLEVGIADLPDVHHLAAFRVEISVQRHEHRAVLLGLLQERPPVRVNLEELAGPASRHSL